MNQDARKYIQEINQSYYDLGEDLLMLESLLLMPEGETGFSEECAASSRQRVRDYALQHMKEIDQLMSYAAGAIERRSLIFP